MQFTFGRKILMIIVLVVVGMLLGMASIFGLLTAFGHEANITDLLHGMKAGEDVNLVRIGLGINHLIAFVLSSILFANIVQDNSLTTYFSLKRSFDPTLLFKFLLLLAMSYPLMGAIVYSFQQLDLPTWIKGLDDYNKAALESLLTMDNVMDLILNIIVIGIIPGIAEELLFRGVIQNELQKKMSVGSYWPLVIAAFIFAAFHGEVIGFIPKFVIGLILGYAYRMTDNLIVPMVIHALNNGMQVLVVYYVGMETASEISEGNLSIQQITFSLLTLPFIFLIIQSIQKVRNGSGA